jgi:L-ascorbate metabolism protein UlaG (beta-lactamase superfamily)
MVGSSRPIKPAFATPTPGLWSSDDITVAWLGHSTVLLNVFGITVLTDPVLFPRIGIRLPFLTLGPKRLTQPALGPRDLPAIDVVLLSHAHFDHFDLQTLTNFGERTQIITASGTKDILRGLRTGQTTELEWGELHTIHTATGALAVRAIEVNHLGPRLQSDTHRGFNGYVIERGGRRIIFSGDTNFTNSFVNLRDGRPYDLAIMSIGAYQPWTQLHCTPEQAIEMADAAGARYIVPIHHQTFRLSLEPFREPIERFVGALRNNPERIALREIGETFVMPRGSIPCADKVQQK